MKLITVRFQMKQVLLSMLMLLGALGLSTACSDDTHDRDFAASTQSSEDIELKGGIPGKPKPPTTSPTAKISGMVWQDANQNGVRETAEAALSGISVELRDGAGALKSTQITSSTGAYAFSALSAGNYSLRLIRGTFSISSRDQGSSDSVDSDFDPLSGQSALFTLAAGQVIASVDAGLFSTVAPPPPPPPLAIDASTINKKHMMGYQGWFNTPNDGANIGWKHWFNADLSVGGHPTFDLWPETKEYAAADLYPSGYFYADGTSANLFSSYKPGVVDVHFRWMKENGLDGVFLQRFSVNLNDSRAFAARNKIAQNVRASAQTHGRVFSIMYDLSGTPVSGIVDVITRDWDYLQNTLQVTASPNYLRENGKPVVAVWGIGFGGRDLDPASATQLINALHARGLYVMGGVPTYWRTSQRDADPNPDWQAVYRSLDMISPWAVGRFGDEAGADNYRTGTLAGDVIATKSAGIAIMPVIFPGFSWKNLVPTSNFNGIPRRGGKFYWRQAYNAMQAGATMLYTAMFDEVDESTAIFKAAPNAQALPLGNTFLSLDADGLVLPSDWYLRVAGSATQMVHGSIPITETLPIAP